MRAVLLCGLADQRGYPKLFCRCAEGGMKVFRSVSCCHLRAAAEQFCLICLAAFVCTACPASEDGEMACSSRALCTFH